MKLSRFEFVEVIKKTPLVAVDLLVRNQEDEVLLGLRDNEPARGFWFVPGGRILLDERITDAFRRIAKEELGIKASIEEARLLGVYEHFYAKNFANEPGFGTHYIIIAYEIRITGTLAKLPEDQHLEFKWLSIERLLNESKVHPYTKAYFI